MLVNSTSLEMRKKKSHLPSATAAIIVDMIINTTTTTILFWCPCSHHLHHISGTTSGKEMAKKELSRLTKGFTHRVTQKASSKNKEKMYVCNCLWESYDRICVTPFSPFSLRDQYNAVILEASKSSKNSSFFSNDSNKVLQKQHKCKQEYNKLGIYS